MDKLEVSKKEGNIRHCAFCLEPIPPEEVKICGKCHKRAYCGLKCQAADWTPKDVKNGKGQGHKSWCGILYGEEDIDWEVASFEGKGQGLKAKRFIPAKSRIMVDGYRTDDLYMDMRKTASTLRRSLIPNHCCDANACLFPDDTFKAGIIYSDKDIQEGEEICTNYVNHNTTMYIGSMGTPLELEAAGFDDVQSFEDSRNLLQAKWGIVCPSDCFCYNETLDKEIKKSKKIDARLSLVGKVTSAKQVDEDLELVKMLLLKHKLIHSSLTDKARILTIGFRVAIQKKKTMDIAKEFIQEVVTIWSSILHPQSELVLLHEKLLNDPKSHPCYLKFKDRKIIRPSRKKVQP